jgi:hypothetical protein
VFPIIDFPIKEKHCLGSAVIEMPPRKESGLRVENIAH